MKQEKRLLGVLALVLLLLVGVISLSTYLNSSISEAKPDTHKPETSVVQQKDNITNCRDWQAVDMPGEAGKEGTLNAIVASSANDIWTVGDANGPLIEHWDGTRWLKANIQGMKGTLNAIAEVSPGDIWAVGSGLALLHWDGSTWKNVSNSSLELTGSLRGITALASNNIWAVGSTLTSDQHRHALILHWDGSTWNNVPAPISDNDEELSSIDAISTANIWAVGGSSAAGDQGALIEHWNGSEWQRLPAPKLLGRSYSISRNSLSSIASISTNNIWAVGTWSLNGLDAALGNPDEMILHWDGQAWKYVRVSAPENRLNGLKAITAITSDNIWAIGELKNSNTRLWQAYTQHWDGKKWNMVYWPNRYGQANSNSSFSLNGVTSFDDGQAWAVGSQKTVTQNPPIGDSMTRDSAHPLVLSLCSSESAQNQ